MLSLLPAIAPMGELGVSLGAGWVAPMSGDTLVFQGVAGPQLELGYQHALTLGLYTRVSWRMVADLDGRSTGVGVGLALGLPADFIVGAQVRMDSQRWEYPPQACLAAWCIEPTFPEFSIAGSLSRASPVSDRLILEYGVHGAAGVVSWSGDGAEVLSLYRSMSAQLWFWPNKAT